MKLSLISSSIAALALTAVANPVPFRVPETSASNPLNPRQSLQCVVKLLELNIIIGLPSVASQASSFCSEYIAQTSTISRTTTQVQTNFVVSTVARTETRTTTVGSGPAPTVTEVVYENCGIVGYDAGISAYRSDSSATTFTTCKALCSGDADCASFASASNNCLLYRTPVLSNTNPVPGSPFTFFDRNCPSPSGAPAARAVRRAEPTSTPIFFRNVPSPVLSTACTCVITRAPVVSTTAVQTVTSTKEEQSLITSVTTAVVTVGSAAPAVTVTVTTTA